MNYIKRISKHYSTKFMNERTTTDSLEANLFFECEPKESGVKLTEEFDLPTIRKGDDDSDSDESCHNVEFASITSFLSQNSFVQTNNLSLAFTNKLQFCAGLSVLISMIVSCSLIGPLTIALPSKSPFIQILWRYFGSTLISILMMIVLYTFKGAEVVTFSNFTLLKLLKCGINSLLIFVWNLGFVLGGTMTIVSHANLGNSSGIFILLFAVIGKRQIHQYELIGYGVFIVGVVLMFLDPFATKADLTSQSNFGIMFSVIGALSGTVYSYINEKSEDRMHPLVAITQNLLLSTIIQLIVFPFIIGPELFFSFDSIYGAFGWLSSVEILSQVIATSLITGILCHMSFYFSYFYFPKSVIAAVMLFEPLFAQIFSVLLGQDLIPGWLSIFGGLVAVGGFAISGYGYRLKFQSNRKVT